MVCVNWYAYMRGGLEGTYNRNPKGTTINHLGGGMVQIKKKFVRKYGEKKSVWRVAEKKKNSFAEIRTTPPPV